MTAVDVDALDKLREAWAAGGWPAVDAMFAVQRALPDLLAEVRRGRALREAVEGLTQELERESTDAADRARAMPRTEENVRHHTAERRHARVASHTASALRAALAAVDPS